MTCWMNSSTSSTVSSLTKSPERAAMRSGRASASQSPMNGTASSRLEMSATGSAAGRPVASMTDAVPTP